MLGGLQVLVTYGTRVLAAGGPMKDPYGQKYKGIWICLQILARALGGNYVNFGVFDLYKDPALEVRWSMITGLYSDAPFDGNNLTMPPVIFIRILTYTSVKIPSRRQDICPIIAAYEVNDIAASLGS